MGRRMRRLRLITVKMPNTYVEGLCELVSIGKYTTVSEAVRIAVRNLLREELWGRENGEEREEKKS